MLISNSNIALWLINRYKSEWERVNVNNKLEIGSEEREFNYALRIISQESKKGIGVEVLDKNVLEIGTGRGGISICIAMNGASKVTGIDISDEALQTAEMVKKKFLDRGLLRPNIVEFRKEEVEKNVFP